MTRKDTIVLRAGRTAILLAGVLFVNALSAQDNTWTNAGNGFWQSATNWSAGTPSTNFAALFITNAATKTVTINATTSGSYPDTLTVNNLTLAGPSGTTNTLSLNNAGTNTPLHILNNFTITDGGALRLTNSALHVGTDNGGAFDMDGVATLNSSVLMSQSGAAWVGYDHSGSLAANNSMCQVNTLMVGRYAGVTGDVSLVDGRLCNYSMYIGYEGAGEVSLSNTAWQTDFTYIGYMGGSTGTLTLAGGTNLVNYDVYLGLTPNSSGSITLDSGRLTITNGWTHVGDQGIGQLTVSGGVCESAYLTAGNMAGSQGTITIAGGTSMVTAVLCAGFYAGATGNISLIGGQLNVINNVAIGNKGIGTFTVSDGVFQGSGVSMGYDAGSSGAFTISGGTVTVGSLSVGVFAGSTGTLMMTGGQLLNPMESTTIGYYGVGQMIVSDGTWLAGSVDVASQTGSQGTLTIAGGTNTMSSSLRIGNGTASTGTVWMTGGSLTVTNYNTDIGGLGTGRMTVSNGTWTAKDVYVGKNAGSSGTLTIAGGNILTRMFLLGSSLNATGTVLITGGQLITTYAGIGYSGYGEMTVSGGFWKATDLSVGNSSSGRGVLSIAGGTNIVSGSMSVGGGGHDSLTLSGGQLIATNGGTYIQNTGTMSVSNGTWMARDVTVGSYEAGTLTLAGGDSTLTGSLTVGSTGTVWMTGGSLTVNGNTYIDGKASRFINSNRLWTAADVDVGSYSGSQGNLITDGGTNVILGTLTIGHYAGSTGTLSMTGGQLITTNSLTYISNGGVGNMTISGAVWQAQEVLLGYNSGGRGTLTLLDSITTLSGPLEIAGGQNMAGDVLLVGGQLTVTNTVTFVGSNGRGTLTVSNGLYQGRMLYAGMYEGSSGTLTIAGGTNLLSSDLTVAYFPGSTGTVAVSGGLLVVTNAGASQLIVGQSGQGNYIQNGGTVIVDQLLAINGAKSVLTFNAGTLSVGGGTINNGSVFNVGDGTHGATLNLRGGTLSLANGVTIQNNATLSGSGTLSGTTTLANGATLAPGNSVGTLTVAGTLSLSSGALLHFDVGALGVNDLVKVTGNLTVGGLLNITDFGGLTNGTYVLLTYGGNLTTNSLIRIKPLSGDLTATLDYGSGSNSSITLVTTLGADPYVEYGYYYFGTPDGIGAKTADADGDGMTNEQEMLAGTDPTDSASRLSITNAVNQSGSRYVLTWPSVSGRCYSVERSTNLMNVSFSGVATNLPAVIPVNVYTDDFSGMPVFYRIRVGPAP